MFSDIVRHLIDHELTSLKELEDITHHGGSIVYGWLNGQKEPTFDDMRHLANHLNAPEAKRAYIRLLTQESSPDPNQAGSGSPSDMLTRSMLAMECLTNLLMGEHQAIQSKSLKRESQEHFVQLIDEVVRHLMSSRAMLADDRVVEHTEPQCDSGSN